MGRLRTQDRYHSPRGLLRSATRPRALADGTSSPISSQRLRRRTNSSSRSTATRPGSKSFSELDDVADRELFTGAAAWLDTTQPGMSAIMLPSGRILARSVSDDGEFRDVDRVLVTGPDITIWDRAPAAAFGPTADLDRRTTQVFGQSTTRLLSRLRVGVVGASGTGSAVVEQLYRLGVGELVLVDPDIVEEKNVGRIYNSTMSDAAERRSKVDVLEDAIHRSGLQTRVTSLPLDIFDPTLCSSWHIATCCSDAWTRSMAVNS